MEFVKLVTFQNKKWVNIWLGPVTHLFHAKRGGGHFKHRDEILKNQDSKCNYCLCPITLYPSADCDCDHIIPVKYSGSSEIENLQLLCVRCHRLKSKQERMKKTKVISFDPVRDGCIYVSKSELPQQYISGNIKPSEISTIKEGIFELITKKGKRQLPRHLSIPSSRERKKYRNVIDIYCNPVDEEYQKLMGKKITGNASQEDISEIEKYQIQRMYEVPVSEYFIKVFKSKKRAIFNRSFINAFPDENLRREIDLHRMKMNESVDDFRLDTIITLQLKKTLGVIGFRGIGDNKIRIDIHDLSEKKMDSIKECVEYIRISEMGRKSEGKCPIKRFQYHLDKILGYRFKRHLKQVGKKRFYLYSLQDDINKVFLDNKIFDEYWIDSHMRRVKDFERNNECAGELQTTFIDMYLSGRMNRHKRKAAELGILSLGDRPLKKQTRQMDVFLTPL